MRTQKQSDAQRICNLKKAVADFVNMEANKELIADYEKQIIALQENRAKEKEYRQIRTARENLSLIATALKI